MNADLMRRAAQVLDEAAELGPAGRGVVIDRECVDNGELRRLVEELLEAHDCCGRWEGAADLLAPPLVDLSDGAGAAPGGGAPLFRIGHYRIERLIAEGGMGAVYEARQDSPSRPVALKLLRTALPTRELLARFRREGELLGSLRHPGIAAVYEAGVAPVESADGAGPAASQPFLAMELVRGPTLLEWSRRAGVDRRQRIELMAQVCDAVEHAHQRGIVHRDLKPANILVEVAPGRLAGPAARSAGGDAAGVALPGPAVPGASHPKVLDFGVARIMVPEGGALTLETEPGRILGTLGYMSPEQAAGDAGAVDRRTDIYALGAILYELLCGQPPLDVVDRPLAEAARIIRDEEPPRLGSVSTVCRGDLETIVATAMARDPARRYATAAALAADLRRYLRNEPIGARPPSIAYRMQKFTRRHTGLVVGTAAVFFILVAGIAATTALAVRATRAEAMAEQRAAELERVVEFQAAQLSGLDVPEMAFRLRAGLLARARDALAGSGPDSEEIDSQLASLEQAITGVSFTDLALEMLDTSLLASSLEAIDEQFADRPEVRARLLQALANNMRDLGLLAQAAEAQETALRIRREVLGDRRPETLESIHHAAALLQARGRIDEAEARLREAMEGRRAVLGDDHPDTLASIRALAGHLWGGDEAEALYREALGRQERILGAEHPATLTTLARLGSLAGERGEFSDAERYIRERLARCRRAFGAGHPRTLDALGSMARVHELQGRFEEAEPYIEELVDLSERLAGDSRAEATPAFASVADFLIRAGKPEVVERHYRTALEHTQRTLGQDHPLTLDRLSLMGKTMWKLDNPAEALSYHFEALEGRRRLLGDNHPHTLGTRMDLCIALGRENRLPEAEDQAREALRGYEEVLGESHPRTVTTMAWAARLAQRAGRPDEAAAMGAEAVRRARSEPRHSSLGLALTSLARIMTAQGRHAEAEAAALEAHRVHAALTEFSDDTRRAARRVVKVYKAWHAAEPDGGYDRKAAEWRARLGPAATGRS